MSTIGSSTTSLAAQIYGGIQNRAKPDGQAAAARGSSNGAPAAPFKLNETPRGAQFLSADANPQDFEAGAPRGSYLNIVV